MGITAAGNTYNPCLILLQEKRFRLWTDKLEDDRLMWNAEKGGHMFSAYSPPELLGIVVLWEAFGADWNRQSPDVLSEVLAE